MSSRGLARGGRRRSPRSTRRSRRRRSGRPPRTSGSPGPGSRPAGCSSRRSRWRSSSGTPIISQMTCSGSSAATSSTNSISSRPSTLGDDGRARARRMLVDELVDHARREPGAHQPAVAGVLRRVHVEERHADHLERLGRLVEHERRAELGRERLVVAADGAHVVVAGDRPEALRLGVLVPVDRRLAPQQVELVVGHGPRPRCPRAGRCLGEGDASWSWLLRGCGDGGRRAGDGGRRRRRAPGPTAGSRRCWNAAPEQQRDDLHRERPARAPAARSRTRRTNRSSAVGQAARASPGTGRRRRRPISGSRAACSQSSNSSSSQASPRLGVAADDPAPQRAEPAVEVGARPRRARRGRRSSARPTARAGRGAALPCRRSGRRARRSCDSPPSATASAEMAWKPFRANRSAAAVSSCARVSARRCSCVRAIPAHYIGSPIYVGRTIFLSGSSAREQPVRSRSSMRPRRVRRRASRRARAVPVRRIGVRVPAPVECAPQATQYETVGHPCDTDDRYNAHSTPRSVSVPRTRPPRLVRFCARARRVTSHVCGIHAAQVGHDRAVLAERRLVFRRSRGPRCVTDAHRRRR